MRGLDERDAHVIFFTSGSTGRPKGVVLSHRTNWLRTYPGATSTPGGGGTVCMFPLFHMAGWTIALGAWQSRRPVHFVRVPDAATLCATTARHRAARLYCIPAVWARVLEHRTVRDDLAGLVEADTGTSATPPELLHALKAVLPWTQTRVFYGSTEAGPGVQLADADLLRKPGAVGLPQAGVDVKLTDAGEVCLRSPFLMDGYFDAPEATADALVDGWYHTGDLGARDAEGYLSIVGRARDVIRTGGETVAPPEVEQVVAEHPGVAEVAVVGVPDPQWGEVITAVIVVRARRAPARRGHAPGVLRGSPRTVQAPAPRRRGRRAPPHPRHRPDPAHPDRRTPPGRRLTASQPRWSTVAGGAGIGFRMCRTLFPTRSRTRSPTRSPDRSSTRSRNGRWRGAGTSTRPRCAG